MSEGRKYVVHEAIGQGGFGTVYRAQMQGEGGFTREVALKVLNSEVQGVDEIAARLRDEARILGLVRHRAVVRADGLVKLADRWSVVMEYVHGVDLLRLIKDGLVPVGPALEIVGEVAGALHVAYFTEGPAGPLYLLHRDIKPANIHLTHHGEVRVLDFGGARAEFESREARSEVLRFGSMGYMSPERQDLIDGVEGDAYALGVVLYELIVGAKVGRASSNRERYEERLAELMEGARTALGPKHAEVVELLGALMSFEPEERPLHRETERRCLALCRSLEGPPLRDWAELVVTRLLDEAPHHEFFGDLSGSTLFEQTGEISKGSLVAVEDGGAPKMEDTWVWHVPQPVLDEDSVSILPEDWEGGGERRRLLRMVYVGLFLALGVGGFFVGQIGWHAVEDDAAPTVTAPSTEADPAEEELATEVVESAAPIAAPPSDVSSRKAPPWEAPNPGPQPPENASTPVHLVTRVPVFVQTVPWRKLKIDGGNLVAPGELGQLSVGSHSLESTAMDGTVVRWTIEVGARAENRFCWDINNGSSCTR